MFEGVQITIEVPLGYDQRDQLQDFMASKFPGAEVLIIHSEVSDPTVSDALVRHDATSESPAESEAASLDSGSVLSRASEALLAFIKPSQ